MARHDKNPARTRAISVWLTPEFADRVSQWQENFGFDSRSEALLAMAMAGDSALPLDTVISESCQSTLRALKKLEFAENAKFHEERARMFRAAAR